MAVTGWGNGDAAVATETIKSTHDALFGGRVVLEQPARGEGYRVNVDAILLAGFAAERASPAAVAFDLGAGVGGVGLALLHMRAARRVVLVENDPATAAMARRNLEENGWGASGEVVIGDARDVALAHKGEAQLVVCNPPFTEQGRGRPSPLAPRARARSGELRLFVDASRALCGRRARACFVYPSHELAALTSALRAAGLEPKRMRAVHATARSSARVVLVEAQAAKSGGLTMMPPLVERDASGESAELRALLARGR